ncbi:MAG: hypothetical protein AMK75_06790 [Planctomycetes bacterium SM23_65]|nr:MAG: hypothetical protein AMK75_06790 [Planctomycetes bacterium SM23_65]
MDVLDRIVGRIREGQSFLVSSHVRLDGDAVASMLAVDLLLHSLDKQSFLLTDGPIPEVFRFLRAAERVVNLEETPDVQPPEHVDTVVLLDVADRSRLGAVRKLIPTDAFTISIDHHRTGDLRADLDWCDPDVSSTGELIYQLFRRGEFDITPEVATNIYTALMSDTQRFSLPNTTAEALRIAAEMVEHGADAGHIGDRVYRSHRPGQLALWGEVASSVRLDPDGKLAWTSLTEYMLTKHGVHPDDTQDFADIARMLIGVEVGVLFRERAGGGVRVSFRSNHIPVVGVAERFGGGGHELACGCELDGTLEDVQKEVLDAVRELLAQAAAAGGDSA